MRPRSTAGIVVVALLLFTVPGLAQEYYVPAAAHAPGVGGTQWRTDLELRAAGTGPASCRVELLASDQDNSDPAHHEVSVAADVESHDPDGACYLRGSDWCERCETWCQQHRCPACGDCAHSQCVNCYQKGKAFWWMLARLAGWEGR